MHWLPSEAQSYLGARGLGSKYLVSEVDPKVDPLSPENNILWATAPLTGAIDCSNSGGYWVRAPPTSARRVKTACCMPPW